jgi:hypothetical protein
VVKAYIAIGFLDLEKNISFLDSLLAFSAPLFYFTQYPDIFLVPRIVYAALNANETVKVYPVSFSAAILSFDSFLPGRFESRTPNMTEQVYPVRRDSQLQDFFRAFSGQQIRTSELG